jgi:F0F1-type ATP synthase membrane subunit b/b'
MDIGINTNLLETNVINLSFVIGVLIYVGGDLLKTLLKVRKETILKSLRDLEARYEQTLAELENATKELTAAQEEATRIRSENISAIEERFTVIANRGEDDIRRFNEAQSTGLEMEQDKLFRKLSNECRSIALEDAKSKVINRLVDYPSQHKLIHSNITLLSKGTIKR